MTPRLIYWEDQYGYLHPYYDSEGIPLPFTEKDWFELNLERAQATFVKVRVFEEVKA